MKVIHQRGSNEITLRFGSRSTTEKAFSEIKKFRGSILKTMIYRRKKKVDRFYGNVEVGYSPQRVKELEDILGLDVMEYRNYSLGMLRPTPASMMNYIYEELKEIKKEHERKYEKVFRLNKITIRFYYE